MIYQYRRLLLIFFKNKRGSLQLTRIKYRIWAGDYILWRMRTEAHAGRRAAPGAVRKNRD